MANVVAEVVPVYVDGDRPKVGAQPITGEARQGAPESREGLLGQILCLRTVPKPPVEEPVDLAPVEVAERLRCLLVSSLGALNEGRFVDVRGQCVSLLIIDSIRKNPAPPPAVTLPRGSDQASGTGRRQTLGNGLRQGRRILVAVHLYHDPPVVFVRQLQG